MESSSSIATTVCRFLVVAAAKIHQFLLLEIEQSWLAVGHLLQRPLSIALRTANCTVPMKYPPISASYPPALGPVVACVDMGKLSVLVMAFIIAVQIHRITSDFHL